MVQTARQRTVSDGDGRRAEAPARASGAHGTAPFTLWDAVSTPSVRNFLVAAVAAVALAALAAGLYLATPATYGGIATLEIDQPRAIAASTDAGVLNKLDRLRVKYAALVPTEPIAGEVRSDGSGSASALAPPNSLLLVITARAGSASDAVSLADRAADRVVAYAHEEQERASIPEANQYVFERLGDAHGTGRIAPSDRRAVAVAAVAAVIGLAIVYVALQIATGGRRLR